MNKFEIGAQWRTRGGWRAVVVEKKNAEIWAWHANTKQLLAHNIYGIAEYKGGEVFDLLDPWSEPREFGVWVEVYESEYNGSKIIDASASYHREDFLDKIGGKSIKTLATKRITIKEGEFCDDHN